MANIFEQKNRNVIPNFRSYLASAALGELGYNSLGGRPPMEYNISENLEAWQRNKSIGLAGDLLSSAIVSGMTDLKQAKQAAEFILSHKSIASITQVEIANAVLSNKLGLTAEEQLPKISKFLDNKEQIYARINKVRKFAIQCGTNAIYMVELSRLYSILGNEKKSIKCMEIALKLAPNNRYVLRSATRLFVHYNKREIAVEFLRNNPSTNFDPWLYSALLATATSLERYSGYVKRAKLLKASKDYSPYSLSELNSGLGTIDYLEGAKKKSKDNFQSALLGPNDNTLAQIEWVNSKEDFLEVEVNNYKLGRNYEALALESYNNEDWTNVVSHCESWFIDMPFNRYSVMMGAHISYVVLDDYSKAELFCRAGLFAQPSDPQLINNLAYALALDGRTKEAQLELDKVPPSSINDTLTKICLTATTGLVNFREGRLEEGRNHYAQAMELAKNKDIGHFYLALLNYFREEVIANQPIEEELVDLVKGIKTNPKDIPLKIFKEKIIKLFNKKGIVKPKSQ